MKNANTRLTNKKLDQIEERLSEYEIAQAREYGSLERTAFHEAFPQLDADEAARAIDQAYEQARADEAPTADQQSGTPYHFTREFIIERLDLDIGAIAGVARQHGMPEAEIEQGAASFRARLLSYIDEIRPAA